MFINKARRCSLNIQTEGGLLLFNFQVQGWPAELHHPVLRETMVILQQGGAAHPCVQWEWQRAQSGGPNQKRALSSYLFAVLMDRFTDVHMEQVEARFRMKVQGGHEFTHDIKVETWTQIKLYCWKYYASTWKTFLLSAIHMTVEWAIYNRLTAELRVKQADSYRCNSWCVFRCPHANTCINNKK